MERRNNENVWATWAVVVLFAAAMAWFEAATVMYLRLLVGRVVPYQQNPLPLGGSLYGAEMLREAATLVMLFSVGWLAGRTWRSRLAYTMVAFGVWDILYYVFLRVIGGWPRSVWEWDVLFLLPVPWWGPVLAPAAVAAVMVLGGTLVSQFDRPERPVWPGRVSCLLNLCGVGLGLLLFMADALWAVGRGPEAVRAVMPSAFNWPAFSAALLLMAAPIADVARQIAAIRSSAPAGAAPPAVGDPDGTGRPPERRPSDEPVSL